MPKLRGRCGLPSAPGGPDVSGGTNPRFAWPIVIDSTCDQFTITEGAGGHLTVDVPDGTYFWRGDNTAADFCKVLKDALDAAGALTYTVTVATTGLLTISATGAWLLHFTVAHDFSAALLGMTDADHASVGNAVYGTFQVGNAWFVQQMVQDDSEEVEVCEALGSILEGGRARGSMHGDRIERRLLIDALPNQETLVAAEYLVQRSFQRFYRYARTMGRFELAMSSSLPGTYSTYQVFDQTWRSRWPATRTPRTIQRWDCPIPLVGYKA